MTILRKSIYKRFYYSISLIGFLNMPYGIASNAEDEELMRAMEASRATYVQEQQIEQEQNDELALELAIQASLNEVAERNPQMRMSLAGWMRDYLPIEEQADNQQFVNMTGNIEVTERNPQPEMDLEGWMSDYLPMKEKTDDQQPMILRRLQYLENLTDEEIDREYGSDIDASIREFLSLDFKKEMHAENIRNLKVQLSEFSGYTPIDREKIPEEKDSVEKREAQIRPIDNPESDEVHRIVAKVMKDLMDSYEEDLLKIKRENKNLFPCTLEPKNIESNDRMEGLMPGFIAGQYEGQNHYQNTLLPQFRREQDDLKVFARERGIVMPDKKQVVDCAVKEYSLRKEVAEKAYAMLMGE